MRLFAIFSAVLSARAIVSASKSAPRDSKDDSLPKAAGFDTNSETEANSESKSARKGKETGDNESALPDELTLETFDSFTSKHLSFIEFYSPYCSHCTQLAPKWKEAFFLTEKDQEESKIYMRQVNCVESGDLCSREDVTSYPNLRLYAPVLKDKSGESDKSDNSEKSGKGKSGKLETPENSENSENLGKGRFVDSYPGALERTPRNFAKYMKKAVAEYNSAILDLPSVSEQMDIDLSMKVVAGEIDMPYFVQLFPSTNEEYDSKKFNHNCYECMEHRQIWDRLSNMVATSARTAHLNCRTHPLVCEKLGFSGLARSHKLLRPQYIMFVPKLVGLIRHDYTGEFSIADMQRFVMNLAANSNFYEISTRQIQDLNMLQMELDKEPVDLYYPISNKLALVFVYDKTSVSAEDKRIMPYLLEMVTKLPFEISLYQSSSKNLDKYIEDQSTALSVHVNSDEGFPELAYDRKEFLATSITSKPTLYIFKENALFPVIFQNFAYEDMRKPELLETFIQKNMFPLYGELTPSVYRRYFLKKGQNNPSKDKVVITFLNTNDATAIKNTLFNLSMVAHQYHALKSHYSFTDLVQARDTKAKKVSQLKESNADTDDIIKQMREHVPYHFDHHQVLFTYVDMVQYPRFAQEFGLNIDSKTYKSGDTIVVSKEQAVYYDTDLQGSQLTSSRELLRETLMYLLRPTLFPKSPKLASKLVGSPYHRHLRFVDVVHVHGVLGYITFFLLAFAAYLMSKRMLHKQANHRKAGIIGNMFMKSD